jgi:DNA-binding GntR family transcriptional regulator
MKKTVEKSTNHLRSEDVYCLLKEKLVSLEFKPGSALMENEIAEVLKVSRTPVRQALAKLERDGLIDIISRKGAFVKFHSLKDILEIFQVRKSLEAYAANLAASNIDLAALDRFENFYKSALNIKGGEKLQEVFNKGIDFHKFIIESSSNTRLEKILAELSVQLEISRIFFLNQKDTIIPGRAIQGIKEHLLIIKALRNRDGEMAEKCMREHIINAEKYVLSFPGYTDYVR